MMHSMQVPRKDAEGTTDKKPVAAGSNIYTRCRPSKGRRCIPDVDI